MRAARRHHEFGPRQRFEQLADGRQRDAGGRGHVGSTANSGLVRREVGEHDRAVVREFADSEHVERFRLSDKGLF